MFPSTDDQPADLGVSLCPPGSPGDQSSGLREIALLFRAGRAPAEALSLAFVKAVLFCPIVETGISSVISGGTHYLLTYSSEATLCGGEGACAWFTDTGGALLKKVPESYGIVLDLGSDSQVILAPWAIHRQATASRTGVGSTDTDNSD